MDTISDIARAFGTQAGMADAINEATPELKSRCSRHIVEKWVQNNVIPSWWIAATVRAARSKGLSEISADLLVEISGQRFLRGDAA